MLGDIAIAKDIYIVAIALGSGLKRRLSVDCMKAGSNVIVEKHIGLSLKDVDVIIKTAEDKASNELLTISRESKI